MCMCSSVGSSSHKSVSPVECNMWDWKWENSVIVLVKLGISLIDSVLVKWAISLIDSMVVMQSLSHTVLVLSCNYLPLRMWTWGLMGQQSRTLTRSPYCPPRYPPRVQLSCRGTGKQVHVLGQIWPRPLNLSCDPNWPLSPFTGSKGHRGSSSWSQCWQLWHRSDYQGDP